MCFREIWSSASATHGQQDEKQQQSLNQLVGILKLTYKLTDVYKWLEEMGFLGLFWTVNHGCVVAERRKCLPMFTISIMDVCMHVCYACVCIYWIFFICYSRVCHPPLLKSQERRSHFHCPKPRVLVAGGVDQQGRWRYKCFTSGRGAGESALTHPRIRCPLPVCCWHSNPAVDVIIWDRADVERSQL